MLVAIPAVNPETKIRPPNMSIKAAILPIIVLGAAAHRGQCDRRPAEAIPDTGNPLSEMLRVFFPTKIPSQHSKNENDPNEYGEGF